MFTKKQLAIGLVAALIAAFLSVSFPSLDMLDSVLMLFMTSLGGYFLYQNHKTSEK